MVLPLVSSIGLHGVAYEQAVATGWAVAWEVLRAVDACGDLAVGGAWVAVRRAILNEHMAAVFGTAPRTAWRLAADDGEGSRRPVSVEVLRESGWEPTAPARPAGHALVTVMVDLMVCAGWEPEQARDVMDVVVQAAPWGPGSDWRWIDNRVDAEPWQVRRLIEVLTTHGRLLAQKPARRIPLGWVTFLTIFGRPRRDA